MFPSPNPPPQMVPTYLPPWNCQAYLEWQKVVSFSYLHLTLATITVFPTIIYKFFEVIMAQIYGLIHNGNFVCLGGNSVPISHAVCNDSQ